jgi:hypothetical protein
LVTFVVRPERLDAQLPRDSALAVAEGAYPDKESRQKPNQTPTDLLAYLQPLWDEAEVTDPRQQVADYYCPR